MNDESPNQAASGSDVFVSYSSQDAAIAEAVVERLEQRGLKCWIAPRDVTPGSQYADEIVGAINDAKALVLVLSEHAIVSPHVGRELERAASKRRRVLALKTDAAPLTRSFEYFLSESQWIDVTALGMPAALARLTEAVGQGSRSHAHATAAGVALGGSAANQEAGTTKAADGSAHGYGLPIKMPFMERLKRRNVGRVAILYVGVCYLILEFFSTFLHVLALPEWTGRTLAALMVAGFPVVLLLSWIFELTPQGIKPAAQVDASPSSRKLTGRRLDFAIIVVLVLALGYFAADKYWLSERTGLTASGPEAGSGAPTPSVQVISDKSIAVLPFADMSEKKDQEYFADGIAEEVLDRLAKVAGLRVVGHTSSFQFKDNNVDPAKIGAALGVAYLLEGSVRKDGNRIRVAAKLVEARTGSQQWSDHFDADMTNIFSVQDTIAAELARALQIAVAVDTTPRLKLKSSGALDAYLRGLQSRNRQSQESCEAAVADFQRALALDPLFAPAAIGLADAYVAIGNEGWLAPRIAFERAREAALLAQRLDPTSPAPHVQMAAIYVNYDWDWAGAERELQKAFSLGPRDTTGVQYAAELAAALGHWDEARQLGIEAIELDPLNPIAHITLGWNIYLHTGQFVEAAQSIRRGLQIAPKAGSGQYYLGEALLLQGLHKEALSEFKKETLDDGQMEGAAMVSFATGRRAESDAQLAQAIHDNGSAWPSAIARVYAYRGEKDRSLEWLEKAYEMRDEDLYVIKGDPFFSNLESDPRFKAFLKKMHLPE